MKTCSVYRCNQNRNKSENRCISRSRGIYLSVYLTIKLFFPCKRQNMSKIGNTNLLLEHFWINFWCLILFTY